MKKIQKRILIISIVCIVLFLIVYSFFKVVALNRVNIEFAQEASRRQEDILNPIFKVEKIIIYSDANIEDFSEKQNLEDVNISQFTDLVVYLDNHQTVSGLTEENTVNKIYIDEISISSADMGTQKVFYKDINRIGNYEKVDKGVSRLDYTVLHKNIEKEENQNENVFFTDCSEPLVMTYVNENILERKDISNNDNSKVSLNGSMLKNIGISLEDLNYKISFKINIENNLGENFFCDCALDVNLNSNDGGIYTGYIMQIYDMTNSNYNFKKI